MPRPPSPNLRVDRVMSLLESIQQEQVSLRGCMQHHHDKLSQQIYGMDVSMRQGRGSDSNMQVDYDLGKNEIAASFDRLQVQEGKEKQFSISEERASCDFLENDDEDDEDTEKLPPTVESPGKWSKDDNEWSNLFSVLRLEFETKTFTARLLSSISFEILLFVVILANAGTMFASLHSQGLSEGWKLGLSSGDGGWDSHKSRFELLECLFNAFYFMELSLRIWVYRLPFLKIPGNLLDAFVVLFSCMDTFLFRPLNIDAVNVSVLRLARFSRVFRLAKFLHFSQGCTELRVLVHTLMAAIRGIGWSIVLLFLLIICAGIVMTQMSFHYLDDQSISIERRAWLYNLFGTTMASTYTMFECTFSTSWAAYSRLLIEEVSYVFAVFWVLWIVLVNFMTMRVVGAIFLRQTMAIAALDQEKIAMKQLRRRKEIGDKLTALFELGDSSGDGTLSQDELHRLLKQEDAVEEFRSIGLDAHDVHALFMVLSSDDGVADYREFINGALAMSSSSPTLDAIKASFNQLKMSAEIHQMLVLLTQGKANTPL